MFCKNHDSKRLIPFLYYSCYPALAAFIFQAIDPGLAFPSYSFYQWAACFRLVMLEALEDLMSVRRLAELRQVDKSRDNVMKKE